MLKHDKYGPLMADLSAFMKTRVILTASELDLFTALDEKPADAAKLAENKGLNKDALSRVLDVLTAFGFLAKQDNIYSVTDQGRLLSSRHPETVLPMALHMNGLWDAWSVLSKVVRKGKTGRKKGGAMKDEASLEAFIGAMNSIGGGLSDKIAGSYDLTSFKRLLDIGGASGTYTVAFLRKNPALRAVIFDLKDVIPLAKKRMAAEGLARQVELVAGDFMRDELPGGCDLALLSAIIHSYSLAENLALYSRIYRALAPGGVLLIRDHIMDETRTSPLTGTLFAINMLVNTKSGNTYTFNEIRKGLRKAGFSDIKLIGGGELMDGIVEARKPAHS